MTVNGRPKRSPKLPKRPPVTPSAKPPTAIELWYRDCLVILTNHLGRAPTIVELARYCERSTFPTWSAMLKLEAKGFVRRNDDRHFEIIGASK